MISTAVFTALAIQCASTVHPDTSLDIAKIESGFNPYAIGVVGQKRGIFPNNINDALAHVNRLKAQGKNYSVGLMQINQSNFKSYNVTAKQLFDPCTNLSVYEKIITDCYMRGKTLLRGLSCYYSGKFDTGQKSEQKFGNTSYVQRIGYSTNSYVVPSTRTDKAKPDLKELPPKSPPVQWPKGIVRGGLISTDAQASHPNEDIRYPSQVMRGSFVPLTETKEIKND